MNKRTHLIFILILLASLVLCISVGSVTIPVEDILHSFRALLTGADLNNQYDRIIYYVRLPRVLSTALVGSMLSLAGATMQSVLKNPLADSSTLGISSGASLGAALAIVSGLQITNLPYTGTAVMASLFALASIFIILALSRLVDRRMSNSTVVLMGIIFSMLTSALLSLILFLFQESAQSIIFWSMGSLAGANYQNVVLLFLTLLVFGAIILSKTQELNAFALGESTAHHLGVDTRRTRILLFVCVAFLVGNSVAVSGTIAFVGLIVPHMVRRLLGSNHRVLLPASIYLGAIFLLLADLLARTLASPSELPIGILTSLVGTLFFIFIYLRGRGGASHA